MPSTPRDGFDTGRTGWRLRHHLGRQMGFRAGLSISAAVTMGVVIAAGLGGTPGPWFGALVNPMEHVAFTNSGTGFQAPSRHQRSARTKRLWAPEPSTKGRFLMRELDSRFGPPDWRDCRTDPDTQRPRCRFKWRIDDRLSLQAIWESALVEKTGRTGSRGQDGLSLGNQLELGAASGPDAGSSRRGE